MPDSTMIRREAREQSKTEVCEGGNRSTSTSNTNMPRSDERASPFTADDEPEGRTTKKKTKVAPSEKRKASGSLSRRKHKTEGGGDNDRKGGTSKSLETLANSAVQDYEAVAAAALAQQRSNAQLQQETAAMGGMPSNFDMPVSAAARIFQDREQQAQGPASSKANSDPQNASRETGGNNKELQHQQQQLESMLAQVAAASKQNASGSNDSNADQLLYLALLQHEAAKKRQDEEEQKQQHHRRLQLLQLSSNNNFQQQQQPPQSPNLASTNMFGGGAAGQLLFRQSQDNSQQQVASSASAAATSNVGTETTAKADQQQLMHFLVQQAAMQQNQEQLLRLLNSVPSHQRQDVLNTTSLADLNKLMDGIESQKRQQQQQLANMFDAANVNRARSSNTTATNTLMDARLPTSGPTPQQQPRQNQAEPTQQQLEQLLLLQMQHPNVPLESLFQLINQTKLAPAAAAAAPVASPSIRPSQNSALTMEKTIAALQGAQDSWNFPALPKSSLSAALAKQPPGPQPTSQQNQRLLHPSSTSTTAVASNNPSNNNDATPGSSNPQVLALLDSLLPPCPTSFDLVPETPRNDELLQRTNYLINLAQADMSTWRSSRRRKHAEDEEYDDDHMGQLRGGLGFGSDGDYDDESETVDDESHQSPKRKRVAKRLNKKPRAKGKKAAKTKEEI